MHPREMANQKNEKRKMQKGKDELEFIKKHHSIWEIG